MDDELTIRWLAPGDASGLVDCFRRCYGESYSNRDFYDEKVLNARISRGSLKSVVATRGELIVGHTGLNVQFPGARVAEAGNTIVDPLERGQGLLARLGEALRQRCIDEGFIGYVHYPTTAHGIMQKTAVAGSGTETGIMLAYIPADSRDQQTGASQVGRLAATIVYQPISMAPSAAIYAPAHLREVITSLARELQLPRAFLPLTDASPECETEALTTYSTSRRLLTCAVEQVGHDFASVIAGLKSHRDTQLIHVDLSLGDVAVDFAAGVLLDEEFLPCGWLPAYRATDVYRYQYLVDQPATALQPDLATESGRKMLITLLDAKQRN